MNPNPFSGSEPPPRYTPKTHVDPYTSVVYELDESGYFWNPTSVTIPNAAAHRPPASQPVPPLFVQHVGTLNPFSPDTIKMASAISVHITNANYNAQLYDRFVQAWADWAQAGRQTKEPPSPKGSYRLADFTTLLTLIMAGVDTSALNPPEVSYNQR